MRTLCLTAAAMLFVGRCVLAHTGLPEKPLLPFSSNDVSVEIVHVQHLDGMVGNTDFTGYEVYHIYADIGPDNFLHALTSWEDAEYNIQVDAECGCYEYPNGYLLADLPCTLEMIFPEIPLDSYLTIGKTSSCDPGEVLLSTADPENLTNAGTPLCGTTIADGSIYAPAGSVNGWADAEGKVLIGQVTTCGAVSFQSCFEVWPFGIEDIAEQSCATAEFIPVYGCMDPAAFNYNPEANIADGSCIGAVSGCTDETACNFEPEANVDNGTCELPGCDDQNACNYDPEAACFNDELCVFIGVVTIEGGNTAEYQTEVVYSVLSPTPGSTYTWTVIGGEILEGQGTTTILVYWSDHVYNNVSVFETNEIDCVGPNTSMNVMIPPPVDPVGISDSLFEELVLYPNPAKDRVQLSGVPIGRIQSLYITTTEGKRIPLPTLQNIDVSAFLPGIYFLEIQTDLNTIKKRLIVY